MRSTKLPSWSKRILGLEPQPVPPHVFGINHAELSYGMFPTVNGSGVRFGEYHRVTLPEDTFNEGPLGGSLKEPARFRELVESLVAKASTPITDASIVLPDDWLRLSFAETEDLPRRAAEREEVLRFKLKLQVPYRVEDLRLSAREVPSLAVQTESNRMLLGYGITQFLKQIEASFEHAGVRLGAISNQSLSLLTALSGALSAVDLAAVALVAENAYSLLITSRGEPLVHRFKSYPSDIPEEALRRLVLRDLRLTRTFLAEKVGKDDIQRVVLVGSEAYEAVWGGLLRDVFEAEPRLLAEEWPFLKESAPQTDIHQMAPLYGAACRQIL